MDTSRILTLAEDVFSNPEAANRWLHQSLPMFGGKSPLEVAQTDSGARVIEQILAKIDWGAVA